MTRDALFGWVGEQFADDDGARPGIRVRPHAPDGARAVWERVASQAAAFLGGPLVELRPDESQLARAERVAVPDGCIPWVGLICEAGEVVELYAETGPGWGPAEVEGLFELVLLGDGEVETVDGWSFAPVWRLWRAERLGLPTAEAEAEVEVAAWAAGERAMCAATAVLWPMVLPSKEVPAWRPDKAAEKVRF